MKERIYVCHTFYHAYISVLKELALPEEQHGQATLVLSTMSCNFGDFPARVRKTGFFEEVILFDEKAEKEFPDLVELRKEKGSTFKNMLARITFTRKYAEYQEPYIPVNFKEYGDIYVFCDSDPIGYYLNKKRIRYHAVEDGLNCLKNFDAARYENRGHFKLKAFLSKKLNLIFVQNGYGKYCKDMEVNDISAITHPCKYYIEVPRKPLVDRLTEEDKELIFSMFVSDMKELREKIAQGKQYPEKVLILTDPLCTLDVRERIFRDIIEEYGKDAQVFLKPHPRDVLDYKTLFAEYPMFDAAMPMEILNFFDDVHFTKAIGVLTEMKGITFADENIRLGADFMDKYEEPAIHRQNEMI
ncbi:MAG: lipooligosaccharide sialyltransferase [Lachnospiraceae bacterium]|nr:lipooligosaccharide sialyltransferase [Lachnospiraceae bacterium]